MDDKRTRNQENCSGKPRGERGREPRRAADGFLLLEALPMLFAAALIAGMPQALQTAANHSDAPAVILKDSNPADQGDQAIEGIEEADEPLITDDLRTKEVMYASADVPRARSAAHRKPGIVGGEGCYPRFVASQRSISVTGMPLRRA